MNTVKVHDDVLDRFSIDTKSLAPPTPINPSNTMEFLEPMWKVKWVRSPDYTYAPIDGPLQNISSATPKDLDNFE